MVPEVMEEVSVLKARIKFKKYGAMKFIGHLDMMRYFQKAMRRAAIPIAFSGGYSPHMIMSFANPLGVGVTSDGEYFDIELRNSITSKEAIQQLQAVMVEGIDIIDFREIPEQGKTGMSIVSAADYLSSVKYGSFPNGWESKIETFLEQEHIFIVKKTKKSEKEVDIRPMIYKLFCQNEKLYMLIATGSVENLKPGLVMQALAQYFKIDLDHISFTHHRLDVYATDEGERSFVTLNSLGTKIE